MKGKGRESSRCKMHTNVLMASLFFATSLVSDCLTAKDTIDSSDVPSSLRATSLALMCCFAAPVLTRPERGVYGILQRPLIAVALFAASFLGLHRGNNATRTFDALFTAAVCLIITWLFSAGGVDSQAKANVRKQTSGVAALERAVVISSLMIASTLAFYANVRIMRAGFQHATEVRHFDTFTTGGKFNTSSSIRSLGYAHASADASFATVAGAAAGVAAALLVSAHASQISSAAEAAVPAAMQVRVAATLQTVAALSASLTLAEQIDSLPAVFGDSACKSDVCAAAAASRRFAIVNTPAHGLWLSAFGFFCLSYKVRAGASAHTQSEYVPYVPRCAISNIAVGLATVALYIAVLNGQDFASVYAGIQLACLAVAAAVDTWTGAFGYLTVSVTEQILHPCDVASRFTQIVSATLLSLTLITPHWARRVYNVLSTIGLSLSTAVFCTSAGSQQQQQQ